jgi:hypothetical protein
LIRKGGNRMNILVDERAYVKDDKPTNSDLFVVVRKNKHQTPYFIISNNDKFGLINLHSGKTNYVGDTVEEVVSSYLGMNLNDKLNPITEYFFVKSYDSSISVKRTFGYEKVNR